jgi:hypothetical protein
MGQTAPGSGTCWNSSMATELISREAAVARLRRALISLQEPGKSMCLIAAERNILCGGFGRYTDEDLRERYGSVAEVGGDASRAELEAKANDWQVARTAMERLRIACDVQHRFYETCRGWDDFTNEALADFLLEIAGEQVTVRGAKTLPVL